VAGLIDELSAAGCDSRSFAAAHRFPGWNSPAMSAFAEVLARVERSLESRGMALRSERLRVAATRVQANGLPGIRRVLADGFFTLSPAELLLLDAVRRHVDVSVTLPEWSGSMEARAALRAMGLEEHPCERFRKQPRVAVVAAGTVEQETEEVARRILEHAGRGVLFREMGIVVRTGDPYVPVLEATLERFGIPARLYFARPLSRHGVIRYISGTIDAMLAGWDHAEVLRLLKMAMSTRGLSTALDKLDFEARRRMPGKGLDSLRGIDGDAGIRELLDSWSRLDAWRTGELPPADWAVKLAELAAQDRPAPFADDVPHERALAWRSRRGALDAFQAAATDAAGSLGELPHVSFEAFWRQVKTALRLADHRVPDQRRNVVHVVDVYEARQWELPVVFVCGLLEKQFPLYHAHDPILPDAARLALRPAGVRLRTAAEADQEEAFLFEMAVTRATDSLVLSYPRFNSRGEENLRSFCLDEFLARTEPVEEAVPQPVRPAPRASKGAHKRAGIRDARLLEWIRQKHATLSPSAIEIFLECPFRFFADKTLRLEGPPATPSERLDPLLRGSVAHATLARWIETRRPIRELLDGEFQDACARARVPSGYRTEAIRRELLRDLERFSKAAVLPGPWQSRTERDFLLEVNDGLRLRGRIDRLDVSPDGQAVVIDYKYSREELVQDRVRQHDQGKRIQGGVYMLAAERLWGCDVVAVLFAALRRDTGWRGWLALPGVRGFGTAVTPEVLRELRDRSLEVAVEAAARIHQGVVEPQPEEHGQCDWCEFCDICRPAHAPATLVAGGEPWP
jgi:hypothetical protein